MPSSRTIDRFSENLTQDNILKVMGETPMKKIVSMILILTSLFSLCAVTVSAASREEEFISDVALIYEDSVEDALEAIADTDWKLYEQDLNPDADYIIDDGVYLIYKTTTNVEEAITDLRVMDMYGGFSTTNYKQQLEKTRSNYMQAIADLRKAAGEFKALYDAGDEMAKLAYRQMNYYKDIKTEGGTETDMLMGDFFLNMPKDDQIVQVFMEGNAIVTFNLVSLLAVGISGADGTTLSVRIAEKYAIKDTLTDNEYYDDADALKASFLDIKSKLARFDSLKEKYNLDDEEVSEEEYSFVTEYATISDLLATINIGETTLRDFIKGQWEAKDLYPIIAAFTPGQKALVEMGQLETVLKYNSPSKPIAELKAALDEMEESMKDENGNLKIFDVYAGVDREIFTGDFAFTNAAERQQALTGETWDWSKAADRSIGMTVGYIVSGVVDLAMASVASGVAIKTAVMKASISSLATAVEKASTTAGLAKLAGLKKIEEGALTAFTTKWGGIGAKFAYASIAFALILAGGYSIATWYNYYNPDYLTIPNTLIDVRSTDLGDKYIKYTAAKVFGEEDMNADFNAYEGKEWIALYYTKDATAGNCLVPKFVHKDNDDTVARRHQGISMFGETEAFNLNSHVYDSDAPGVYVTVRYSTTEKAAADMPSVVGSMFATGALYTLAAVGGAGLGVGGTLLVLRAKKKKEEPSSEASE